VKGGLSFEYSASNQLISAIDAGIVFDAFAKKIPIMYTDLNSQLFLTLFVSYRFGWVVNARYKTPKITKEANEIGIISFHSLPACVPYYFITTQANPVNYFQK
jgi:hypothetical protein